MKKLLALALVALMAAGAMAQDMDEFGLWAMEGGEYVNGFSPILFAPFQLYLTVHNTSSESIAAYEASINNLPATIIVTAADFQGGTNFGDNVNHLVGFPAPIPGGELIVLSTLSCIATAALPAQVELGPSVPSSVDGAGPAYADGVNPDNLVVCGYITGQPWVFTFEGAGPVGTQNLSFSQVKALFN